MVEVGPERNYMSDRVFLDSNILIYTVDERNSQKQNKARSLIDNLVEKKTAQISTQTLQEFFNVVTKKLSCPKEEAKEFIENYSKALPVHKNSVSDILHAIEISIKTQFTFWDSLIISAAISENCNILYSEDLNDGQIVEGVAIINPFKES